MSETQADIIERIFKTHGLTKRTRQTITLKKRLRYYIKDGHILDITPRGSISLDTIRVIRLNADLFKELKNAGCVFHVYQQS